MAVAEAKYGRMDESLRYLDFIANELDVEQPGTLPELFPSPDSLEVHRRAELRLGLARGVAPRTRRRSSCAMWGASKELPLLHFQGFP
jgi:hypothetical protein